MKPRPFDYARPDTVEEAVALLAEYGDEARVLAGGQSLMAMMNLRLADPAVLVDIARIAELGHIRDLGDTIEVGAAVTQNTLLAWAELKAKLPLLWPPPCPTSAISRPATRARSAARSPMPIQARRFRCRSPRSKAKSCCAASAASAC